jgi:hypothetical protein
VKKTVLASSVQCFITSNTSARSETLTPSLSTPSRREHVVSDAEAARIYNHTAENTQETRRRSHAIQTTLKKDHDACKGSL